MPNRSKEKGNRFERYIVSLCEQTDIPAKRAWGSDGRSLGVHEEVDIVIDSDITVQAKCRHRLPAYILPSPNIDMQAYQVFMDDFMQGVKRIKRFTKTKTGTGFIKPQDF